MGFGHQWIDRICETEAVGRNVRKRGTNRSSSRSLLLVLAVLTNKTQGCSAR